uniref:folate gamma-glutamyl hydrolase n=1 Tax=Monopterus albus TaxID=43700 RepID=A0A3Q3IVL4_MONAL
MSLPVVAVFAALTACLFCGPPPCAAGRNEQLNYRPIIGVLAQENLPGDQSPHGSSYIAASYVKYLESAGARVVPIRINLTEEEYTKIFFSINGLLLPGGDVDIETSQFTRAAKIFYSLALKANDAGDYFPLWGTCQGFQQLSVITANKNLLTLTDTKAVTLPLTFTPAAKSSRLFQSFPKDLMQSLADENITSNFHMWSLSTQNYSRNAKLKKFYKVLSTNTDGKKEFISTMEAYRYPFYAVQWHPEKSPFEWINKSGMNHSTSAVRASFYTARFFVTEGNMVPLNVSLPWSGCFQHYLFVHFYFLQALLLNLIHLKC